MDTGKVKGFISSMPPWAKGVIGVLVAGGAALLVRNIIVSAKRRKQDAIDNAAAITANSDLQKLLNGGMKLSYGDSQYEAYAQELVEAMRGCGTNEDKVMEVFTAMNNTADVLKLISVFGQRVYQVCPLANPITSVEQLFGAGQNVGGSLIWWLNYDMSNSDIDKLNTSLSAKGINYKF